MQKLAIFGGTFDPIHWGHLLLAEMALSQFGLDRVIWVPSRCPPHKSGTSLESLEHRLEMVRRAIAEHPAFALESVEADRIGPAYAIDTLTDLQALYPNTQWYWILGLDAFQTLPRWYRRQDLIPTCDWLVAPRPAPALNAFMPSLNRRSQPEGIDAQMQTFCQPVVEQLASQAIPIRWHILQMPSVSISSSLIRSYCRRRRSIRYLVPETVRTYILTQKLYQQDCNSDR